MTTTLPGVAHWDVAFDVTALLAGALLGPVFLGGLVGGPTCPSTAKRELRVHQSSHGRAARTGPRGLAVPRR